MTYCDIVHYYLINLVSTVCIEMAEECHMPKSSNLWAA